MTREETAKILDVLLVAYPHAFKNVDKTHVLKLWTRMFELESYQEVNNAVYTLIATRQEGFSPTIGEVKAKIRALRARNDLSEQEAWALVARAASNGYYNAQKEFDKLPPAVQRAVGSPNQLREWALVDTQTFQTVVASNFMRSYKVTAEREKELEMLPESVRTAIQGMADKLSLVGREEELS